jgi:hypothetical protein
VHGGVTFSLSKYIISPSGDCQICRISSTISMLARVDLPTLQAPVLLPVYLLVRGFYVYLAGACNVGKSTLASIPIGEEISCLLSRCL